MRDWRQLYLGLAIILVGIVWLVGSIAGVDVWDLCWPAAIILLGLVLLFRPRFFGSAGRSHQRILGDIRRYGSWQVTDQEFWLGIGDLRLDMTEAEIPPGETRIRVSHFVGDVRLTVPEDVGVSVSSNAFVVDVKALGQKREGIMTPVVIISDGYESAERKIRLETSGFVGDVRVRRR